MRWISWLWLCRECRLNLCWHRELCMLVYARRPCLCADYRRFPGLG